MIRKILTPVIIALLGSGLLSAKPVQYKEFILGDSKENILKIISRYKYSRHTIYLDNNDRYIDDIKVKSENSIKIIIKRHMEKEELLLVFNSKNILFDIYTRTRPVDIRDYIDYKVYMNSRYGRPVAEQTLNSKHIITWRMNKRRNALYLIYSSRKKSLLINMRDTMLNMNYSP